MEQSLEEEIRLSGLSRLKAGQVSKAIWEAAVNDLPSHPAVTPWVAAQIRQSLETKGEVDVREIAELFVDDELITRRMEGHWEELRCGVIEKLVEQELAQRVADGTVIEVVMENGETGYTRA